MPQPLFYLFAILALLGAGAMVLFKNPVACALSMVGSFVGLAALFIGLNAYFVGTIQILVYAGAIMVLFIFIIMLLDLKSEESRKWKPLTIACGAVIPVIFLAQLLGVMDRSNIEGKAESLDLLAAAEAYGTPAVEGEEVAPINQRIENNLRDGQLPDVHLIGTALFKGNQGGTSHHLPLQVMGVLLLVATIGVVALSKKGPSTAASESTEE